MDYFGEVENNGSLLVMERTKLSKEQSCSMHSIPAVWYPFSAMSVCEVACFMWRVSICALVYNEPLERLPAVTWDEQWLDLDPGASWFCWEKSERWVPLCFSGKHEPLYMQAIQMLEKRSDIHYWGRRVSACWKCSFKLLICIYKHTQIELIRNEWNV